MQQSAAPTSLSITIVTTFFVLITAGVLVAAVFHPLMWIVGGLLVLAGALCYLLAPVSYALEDGRLIVNSHIHSKEFPRVVRCTQLDNAPWLKLWVGIRLFGNGGLFAGTGIFWNRLFGIHRAYVTSGRRSDLVLVETMDRKIVISPEDPATFVESWRLTSPSASS